MRHEALLSSETTGGLTSTTPFGYAGGYTDPSGLIYLINRYFESVGEWVTNRVVPGKVILGQLGDIEAGVRQLIRTRPLETTQITLPSGNLLTVPTAEETLRVKGFLIVRRNQTRDYLDVAALADRYGRPRRQLFWPGLMSTTRTSTVAAGAWPRSWFVSLPIPALKTRL